MKQKIVCIIPARGGSKRIPEKNLSPLGGKPLLAHTVEAVLHSGCFADTYVSSDHRAILDIAEDCGARFDLRPDHLSGDGVKAVEVVHEFLTRPGHLGKWDSVAMCLPTCPFRSAQDIIDAVALFLREKEGCPRLIGVTRCDFPPQLALRKIDEANLVDMREPESYGFSTRSQDLETLYYPNGSIYMSTVERYLKTKTFFGRPMVAFVMPAEQSLDVDYPYQLKIAECMMKTILS